MPQVGMDLRNILVNRESLQINLDPFVDLALLDQKKSQIAVGTDLPWIDLEDKLN